MIAIALAISANPVLAEISDTLQKLASGRGNNDQLDAASAIAGNRDEVIRSLLRIAQTGDVTNGIQPLAKQLAIDCLGDYRTEKAVDFLVANISFEEVFPTKGGISGPYVWGFPCVLSLIQIGRPAIDGILARVREPAKRKELAIFDFVIHDIEGEEVGLYRLRLELKKADGVQQKQLQSMIDMYREHGWLDPKYLTDESSPASKPRK